MIDSDIKAQINKCKPRKVYRFKDANWDLIREDALKLTNDLLEDFDNDVDTNWRKFKSGINQVVEKHVPSRIFHG